MLEQRMYRVKLTVTVGVEALSEEHARQQVEEYELEDILSHMYYLSPKVKIKSVKVVEEREDE